MSASSLFLRQQLPTAVTRGRFFSSTSGDGNGAGAGGRAAGIGEDAAVNNAGTRVVEPPFPWRSAPSVVVQPESVFTKMFLSMFMELNLIGEDIKVSIKAFPAGVRGTAVRLL